MTKLKQHVQGHSASMWQSQDSSLGLLSSEPKLLRMVLPSKILVILRNAFPSWLTERSTYVDPPKVPPCLPISKLHFFYFLLKAEFQGRLLLPLPACASHLSSSPGPLGVPLDEVLMNDHQLLPVKTFSSGLDTISSLKPSLNAPPLAGPLFWYKLPSSYQPRRLPNPKPQKSSQEELACLVLTLFAGSTLHFTY